MAAIEEMVKLKIIKTSKIVVIGIAIRLGIFSRKEPKMGKPILSLMRQFTPTGRGEKKRKISSLEFKTVLAHALKLGLDKGFVQDEDSASDKYIPSF